MAQARRAKRTEFINRTQGWIGAVTINRKGDDHPVAVESHGRVFLTDEEIELTASAHARKADSPFEPREITWHYLPTGEVAATFTAPALQKASELPEDIDELPEFVGLKRITEREAAVAA